MAIKLDVIIPVYNQEELITRAMESVPKECNLIVVDDGSTDMTNDKIWQFMDEPDIPNTKCIRIPQNSGVAHAINRGLDESFGDYVVLLGSDDYLISDGIRKVMEHMGKADLIYFDLETNDGSIFHLDQDNKNWYCGSVKLMRRKFIGDTRNDESKRSGEDFEFFRELQKKNPTEIFTDVVAKHYNFPREGSLSWNQRNGVSNG